MAKARNNEELNDAMRRGESTIEIEGILQKKVIRLKATGSIAWAIAIGAFAVAVLGGIVALPAAIATGGIAAPVEAAAAFAALTPAVAILGFDVTVMAIGLAIAAGGVGILTSLRSDYKIVGCAPDRVVLAKKSSSPRSEII